MKALRSHIDAIRDVTGSHRHTAIGTDFDGFIKPTLAGIEDMRDLAKLRVALEEHYKSSEVEAICCGNAMRLLTEAWAGA